MKKLFSTPLGFLTFSIAIALVLPLLMMDGMFMDATMYTAVGHNLANGYGTPWFLFYSAGHLNVPGFFENPPLGYWLYAAFFKIFGSSLYVERFYVLLMYLLSMPLILKLWNQLLPAYKNISWISVLMWVITPLTFWAYTNNIMEVTMTIFVLASIICSMYSLTSSKNNIAWAVLAGLLIFLAFMVKGFPGMYPLVTIALHWLIFRGVSFNRALGLSLVVALSALIPLLILFAIPHTAESLGYYLFVRTFDRINAMPTVDNRFRIIWDLVQQIIVPAIVAAVILIFSVLKWNLKLKKNQKVILFLFLLGLCGVLPLALTRVQRGFYLVPAIPILTMAISVLLAGALQVIQAKLTINNRRIIFLSSSIVLLMTIVFSIIKAGEPKRDVEMLSDVHKIAKITGDHRIISAPIEVSHNWSFKAYLMRYHFIQLDYSGFENREPGLYSWLLMPKGEEPSFSGYEKHPVQLNEVDMYRR